MPPKSPAAPEFGSKNSYGGLRSESLHAETNVKCMLSDALERVTYMNRKDLEFN